MSELGPDEGHDPTGGGPEDVHLLVGAYALDALDDDERAAFEAHLPGCPACRDDLAGFAATAGLLAEAAAEAPPAGLRHTVLAQVDATRQDPPDLGAARRRRADRRLADHRTRPDVRGWVLGVAAAVLVLALVLTAAVALQLRSEVDRLDEVSRIATAPDATTVELTGEGGGTVRVTASAALGQGLVVGDDLAGLPDDRTYQLWVIDADGPASVDTFRPGADGRVELVAAADLGGALALGVTEEPAGGSPQPTGDILLAADLDT